MTIPQTRLIGIGIVIGIVFALSAWAQSFDPPLRLAPSAPTASSSSSSSSTPSASSAFPGPPPPPLTSLPPLPETIRTLPGNWFGLGAAYAGQAHPPVSGWYSYAILLSTSAKVYSFTTTDIVPTLVKPYSIQHSTRTGIAPVIRDFGPVAVLGIADAGMSVSGSSVGGAFSAGGIVVVRLGSTHWSLAGIARRLRSNAAMAGDDQWIYELGLGRSW